MVHARGEGERVLALESREGTRASRRVEEHPRPLSLLQRGLAPRSKGKARAELRPARRQSLTPLSGCLSDSAAVS